MPGGASTDPAPGYGGLGPGSGKGADAPPHAPTLGPTVHTIAPGTKDTLHAETR